MKLLLALFGLLALAPFSPAQDKAVLRGITATFDKIEAGCETWPHYRYAADNLPGGGWEHEVWESDVESGLSKVVSRHFGDHDETRTEFYFKGDDLIFTLDRSENTRSQPDAPTEVMEKRYFFAGGQLIRLLEKQGSFPAGKATDTALLKNREVPLQEAENGNETYTLHHQLAAGVLEQVRRFGNDRAVPADASAIPATASHGTAVGNGWRVIAGSGSRDGQYALAWGLKGQQAIKGEPDEDGALSVDQEDPGLVNYLVDLRNRAIVGTLDGKHFGDKSTYNHSTCETAWSSASLFTAQINSGKWATYDATIYQLNQGTTVTLTKGTDLLTPVKKAVFAKLAGSPVLKKHNKDDFAISLHDVSIAQRGAGTVVVTEVVGEIPKSPADDASFEATVTFTLTYDDNGGAPALKLTRTEIQ